MPVTEVAGPTRRHSLYPALGTGPVPVGPCFDPDYYDLERQRIFGRTWLYFGRAEALSRPGDFSTKTFEAPNAQVLVTRASDGELRAFHNICPHRGRALTDEAAGNCQTFTCAFHGWTFDPEGRLTGVPDECQFIDLDRLERGLLPVAVDTWHGFVFVNLNRPQPTLAHFLGDLEPGLGGHPLGTLTEKVSDHATYTANWKLALDVFQDGYRPSRQSLAVRLHALHRSARMDAGGGPVEVDVVFPNLVVSRSEGLLCTQEFWPLALDRTRHEVNVYFGPGQAQRAVELLGSIREAASNIEPLHAALSRGALLGFTLGDDEIAIRHSHKVIETFAYGDEPYTAARALIARE